MHARYYSHNLGRFLSVDPVGGSIGSSQSWNRYSYVLNNPLKLIDPDGRIVVEPEGSRLKASVSKWRSTPAGSAAYKKLHEASGAYRFERVDRRLTARQRFRLQHRREIKKTAGHFTPARKVEGDKVTFISGGVINVDFSTVDNATGEPYGGPHGDAAILAHETGHAVHWEEDREEMFSLEYEELEEVADEHRDEVVEQLSTPKDEEEEDRE